MSGTELRDIQIMIKETTKAYPKYVSANQHDLRLAIESGISPILSWLDPKRENLPYFWNYINGERFGNHHHITYSAAHMPGRKLEALSSAAKILLPADMEPCGKTNSLYRLAEHYGFHTSSIDAIENWAYRIFENSTGMMGSIDLDTLQQETVLDLHNLREVMYAFVGIIRANPSDQHAIRMALHIIQQVNRYTDPVTGEWNVELYEKETGGKVICSVCNPEEGIKFTAGLGRYIEALMRLYSVCPLVEALEQAVLLQRIFFRTVLPPDGSFSPSRFCLHTHSVTASICGIALLGEATHDRGILDRIDRFMKNGFYDIALDLGWSTENCARTDWVGEINNSCDLMETCLVLGRCGYEGYDSRAEQMLRSHILPAQLLDVSFIPDIPMEDDSISHLASRMRGAFGFPCPYGHEEHPGSEISFNWDITAGGVSGLCQAMLNRAWKAPGVTYLRLLFDYEDDVILFTDPYKADGRSILYVKKPQIVRLRIPNNCRIRLPENQSWKSEMAGEWMTLTGLPVCTEISLEFQFMRKEETISYNGNELHTIYVGESLRHIDHSESRLRFFR